MKKFLAPVLGLVLAFGLFSVDASLVFAQDVTTGTTPNQMISPGDNPNNVEGATSFGGSARQGALTIINYFLYFLGLVATIMVIYGGFLYITSQGEDTEKAKKILLYAIVGIIIILIYFAVVNTILGAGDATGTGQE